LKESLEKHIVKKPKHKDLIEDIIYLIHKRIEA
jgi:hypothetical protein